MSPHPTAEQVLKRLGVAAASDIDLDAIAWDLGIVSVKERVLDGCEARIVGLGDRAIVSLDPRPMFKRRRFSLAHEIGHWIHHRGKTTFCRMDDIGDGRESSSAQRAASIERTANMFASDLLLPEYLVRPFAKKADRLTMKLIGEVSDAFRTTKSATALKLLALGEFPAFVISYGRIGRRWFQRSSLVPARWFPKDELDHETYAFDLLNGRSQDQPTPRKIGADAFFERRDAGRFDVHEQSFRTGEAEIVTILTISDTEMLDGD